MITTGEIAEMLRKREFLQQIDQTGKKEFDKTVQIRHLTCDSRTIVPGTLFICKGAAFRPEYLQQAADRGCVAYLCEQPMETEQRIPGLIVQDIRKAMAAAAAAVYSYRPGEPVLTGITGTKGKTTTAWYLKAMLDKWEKSKGGQETGLISTVETYDGRKREDAVMTTPEAPRVHELLANAKTAGVSDEGEI